MRGIVVLSWTVSLVGAVLTALGAGIGVLGGALRDARPEFSVGEEIREVKEGTVHRGVGSGEMIDDPRVRADALRTSRSVRERLGAQRASTRSVARSRGRALARPAGATLLGVTVGLYVLTGSLVTSTPTGHAVALRAMGLSIVIGVAGFRIMTVPGRHPLVAAAALVAGAILMLLGVLAAHGDAALGPIEATCGALAVAGAVTAWLSPVTPQGAPPAPAERVSSHPKGRAR